MTTTTLKEIKTTTRDLESLIKIAKKQLLLLRIGEAEKNFATGNFKVLKNIKSLLK